MLSPLKMAKTLEAHMGKDHWELWDPKVKMGAWAIIPGSLDDPASKEFAEELAKRWNKGVKDA